MRENSAYGALESSKVNKLEGDCIEYINTAFQQTQARYPSYRLHLPRLSSKTSISAYALRSRSRKHRQL
jgi:hypothetical protein